MVLLHSYVMQVLQPAVKNLVSTGVFANDPTEPAALADTLPFTQSACKWHADTVHLMCPDNTFGHAELQIIT